MIINIKSPNKHLLDLLFKNPETDEGLYFKPLKNGVVVGNVVSPNEYEILFQDTKGSYLPEDGDQLDFQSYCSPLCVLHVCTELFNHVLKDKESFNNQNISWLNVTQGSLDTEACTIEIPTFYIHSSWYRDGQFLLSKYFKGVSVEHQQGKNFKLQVVGHNVFEAINLLNLVALLTFVTNEYGIFKYIDDAFAEKYIRVLTNVDDVPYFVFYLYIKRTIKSNKQFQLMKPIMEAYLKERGIDAELTFYGTQQDRQYFITDKLELDIPVLDIGCGEFSYYKRMMNKGLQANYYAVDEDVRFEKLGEMIANRIEAENLYFFTKLSDAKPTEKVNIIMSEVIEHNSMEDATALIIEALQYDFNKIIVTTPNADFNKYYFDEGRRHDDHHFEFTQEDFKAFLHNCIKGKSNIELEFLQIGDKLNGIQPTQACIIKQTN